MKYSRLVALSFGLVSLTAVSQVDIRTSDLLRLGGFPASLQGMDAIKKAPSMLTSSGEECVECILRYDDSSVLDDLESQGGEVISVLTRRSAIVSVPVSRAQSVAALKGVRGIALSRTVKPTNDKAAAASRVDAVREGTGLPYGLDGSDVVVGLFDVGIDPNHINFRDSEGNLRVSRVWHYETPSAKATVYDTPQKISTFDSDTGSESHGTHVAGVMAGSFHDTSDPAAPDYRGMAPGAELVIATGEGYNVQILDGARRIAEYAASQGKPCVINLSFGDNLGPHDGSDEFTEALNDIAAEYGAVMCLSGGNERDEAIAIVKQLTADDPRLSTLLVKGYGEVGGYFQTYSPIEIWTEDDTPFEVTLDIVSRSKPDEPVYSFTVPTAREGYVTQGDNIRNFLTNTGRMDLVTEGTEFHTLFTNSFMGGKAGVDPYNGRYCALLNVYIEGRTASAVSRNFVKVTVKGEAGKKIFMYCDGSYMNFGNRNIPGLDVPDGYGTNSNMACGKETFAVGSYVTANHSESPYPFSTIGEASYFSSYGETLDGRVMPDVMAPGQVIISSRNSHMGKSATYLEYYPVVYTYKDNTTRKSYDWTLCAGTSQASPHVAGIMALMRSANPSLSPSEIYDIVRQTASDPDSELPGWGYGKVDAYEAVKAVLRTTSVSALEARGVDGVLVEMTGDECRVTAPGEEWLELSVYDLSGVCRLATNLRARRA